MIVGTAAKEMFVPAIIVGTVWNSCSDNDCWNSYSNNHCLNGILLEILHKSTSSPVMHKCKSTIREVPLIGSWADLNITKFGNLSKVGLSLLWRQPNQIRLPHQMMLTYKKRLHLIMNEIAKKK